MRRILTVFVAGLLGLACSSEHGIQAEQLLCEYLKDPAVVDVEQPRLGWVNEAIGGARAQHQSAYQIRVASSREDLENPDLWDSGKTKGSACSRIPYQGKDLQSRQECWWQVRVWDGRNNPSPWSDAGFWRMGLLENSRWKASWIGAPWQGEEAAPRGSWGERLPSVIPPPAPLLRKGFALEKKVKKAVAYVCGLGYFELWLNGEKVGHDVLVPNQTNYGKRPQLKEALINLPDEFSAYKVMYLAYDVKDLLLEGDNALGAILGNGFYNPSNFWAEGYGSPRFLCQLHIEYQDGSEELVLSDPTWKASRSPILRDLVYFGEIYDARQAQKGWSLPGFDDGHWEYASPRKPPAGQLVAHTARGDRVNEQFDPLSIEKMGEGHYLVDFGTEISGWVRFRGIDGPAGQEVHVSFNGNEYSGENTYICSGKGPEDYAPRFNWFVFSGVEIRGWPGELSSDHLVAEAVHTPIEATAEFHTSNELFNQINTIWRRSQTDNMHGGIASDCPHRERSGYTGDGQLACNTVLHNYDARNFYHKWIADMRDAQQPGTGYVPNGAPWQPTCGGGPAWGAAICIMPWEFYLQYGSLDMLESNFDAMEGYLGYLRTWIRDDGIMHSRRRGQDGEVLKWFNLGEWLPPGELMPEEMAHTFILWYCARIVSECAGVLGREAESREYDALAERTRTAFMNGFYDEAKGTYGKGGGNILALKMGVPEDRYARIVAALESDIAKNKGHIDTGILGTRFYFEVLAAHGLNHLAYEAMNKRTEPSFGRWIELGSTTTRENWSERGSFNHPMFGGGLVWFYRNLAGMQTDPKQPGYRHIIFRPQPLDEVEHVRYFNRTPYGKAGISWMQDKGFRMEVQVPVSCSATVYVPTGDASQVLEGDGPAGEAQGVAFLGMEGHYAVYRVQSGRYQFRLSPAPGATG